MSKIIPQGVPAGVTLPFAGPIAPLGYLLCDGSTVSRLTYAGLFAAIGTVHGAGNGTTTFHLPDMRGRFARGSDNMGSGAAGRDADRAVRPASNAGGATGEGVGSAQGDAIRNLYGEWYMPSVSAMLPGDVLNGVFNKAGGTQPFGRGYDSGGDSPSHVIFNASNTVPTASDNRPQNVNMNYIIKI